MTNKFTENLSSDESKESQEKFTDSDLLKPPLDPSPSHNPEVIVGPMAHDKKPRGIFKIIMFTFLGVVIVCILAISGMYAYGYVYRTPEKIIQDMTDRVSGIKSFEYAIVVNSEESKINTDIPYTNDVLKFLEGASISVPKYIGPWDVDEMTNKEIKYTSDINGVVDFSNNKNMKGTMHLNQEFNIDTDPLFVSALETDHLFVDNAYYLKLNNVSFPYIISSEDSTLSPYINTWIKMTDGLISDVVSRITKIVSQEIQDEVRPAIDGMKISETQREELKQAYRDHRFVLYHSTMQNRYLSTMLHGEKTYHYSFTIDVQKLQEFVTQFRLIYERNEIQDVYGVDINNARIQILDTMLTQYAKRVESAEGEIWIGKDDLLPRKILIKSTLHPLSDSTSNVQPKTYIELSLNNFNKNVYVDTPAQLKSISDIVEDFFPTQPDPSTIDTDNDGLTDAQEESFGTDASNPDTDGDGFTDGEEVKNGYNPNGPGVLKNE